VLGLEHPDTATSYNNIGGVYASQGDYPKALEYYLKALAILENKLGKDHPYTQTVWNNIEIIKSKMDSQD
jgi:tetratricopeptide (TPR) repeat protein